MSQSTSSVDPSKRIKLLLVIAVFAAPVAGAYLAYKFWRPTSTMNYGELIAPTQMPTTPLTLANGGTFSLASQSGKWLMVSVDSGPCMEACEHKLYLMRQLRTALGKHQDRIERVWLIEDAAPLEAELVKKYLGTLFVRAAGADWLSRFPVKGSVRDHLYLIDPLGNLMMRYPKNPDAKRVLRDLNRLMTVSQVG
jgi:cytochrome oxidase Cu insertion factor (SCO1/SenC/PrrC family)